MQEVLERNIQALYEMRAENEKNRTIQERVADTIANFTGSMPFVYFHFTLLITWITWNLGWLGIKPFDPYPFILLASFASVEAIFLSTFVLVNQNRLNRLAEKRAELDLQISLLSEHEVTRLILMTDLIAKKLGINTDSKIEDLADIKKDVPPDAVLRQIERAENEALDGASH